MLILLLGINEGFNMKGFKFERNLPHQKKAVNSTIATFENIEIIKPKGENKKSINPQIGYTNSYKYVENIHKVRKANGVKDGEVDIDKNIVDIMMETGTGKTYTYTKTIFELNKSFGIFKFIIVVPTLSIKAGTINFLKSKRCREHFAEQYNHKKLDLHIVESQKNKKNKKAYFPPAISDFVNADTYGKNSISVMVINTGMINSKTMFKEFDTALFDKYNTPFEAIASLKSFMIIDEPHKFAENNKSWGNIEKMNPQFILRYGATFPDKEIKEKIREYGRIKTIKKVVKDYRNLIYTLNAVDSFNDNLVKGVIGHIIDFADGNNASVKFTSSDGIEANFELKEGGKTKIIKLKKGDSVSKIHFAISDLVVESLNKSKVVLDNGMELKKGDKLSPYSFIQSLQETMLQKAVENHFKIEKKLLTRECRIKPITLFFIDNIKEYRNKDGFIKITLENCIKAEVKKILETEKNDFYIKYLKQTLKDLSSTHGGYFSEDNSNKDEKIDKEINEILHDKEAILSLENPRRFIFSKWTLREGWDNPNVFQICKMRSSGSEISKLQEVGRGLRLPVNEFGDRVKDEQFYLNYFVDFTESDFIDKLIKEVNTKSGVLSIEYNAKKLTDEMIKKICEKYDISGKELLNSLDNKSVINRENDFEENGYQFIKDNYPLIFANSNGKIIKATDKKQKINIRPEKYQELKELWKELNKKVILEYKFKHKDDLKNILVKFLEEQKSNFSFGINRKTQKIKIKDQKAYSIEEISVLDNEITAISTMKYSDFLLESSRALNITLQTLHKAFIQSKIEIDKYLNHSTVRILKQNFNNFLMLNAFSDFEVGYKKISNSIHPTKFTNAKGDVLKEVSASDIGIRHSENNVAENYLLDGLFYDSELEKINIEQNLEEVIVFSKIPKNSIKIPVAGGKSYSPDFAYVLNYKDNSKKMYFVVETKNTFEESLRSEERQKIKHAERFFNDDIKIKFKTQFSNQKIEELFKEITTNNPLAK
jgi:type III restriction enzyme